MELEQAKYNQKQFESIHSKNWNIKIAPYKVLATLDFGSVPRTDIDCTQVAKDLSIIVQWEEKFYPQNEFNQEQSLAVQKRYLEIADKANIPALLILTSRRKSMGIVCGNENTGIDWNRLLDTMATLITNGDIDGAKSVLGNGVSDLYGKSNVIDIILNETARKRKWVTVNDKFWTDYKNSKLPVTVDTLDELLDIEFPNLYH